MYWWLSHFENDKTNHCNFFRLHKNETAESCWTWHSSWGSWSLIIVTTIITIIITTIIITPTIMDDEKLLSTRCLNRACPGSRCWTSNATRTPSSSFAPSSLRYAADHHNFDDCDDDHNDDDDEDDDNHAGVPWKADLPLPLSLPWGSPRLPGEDGGIWIPLVSIWVLWDTWYFVLVLGIWSGVHQWSVLGMFHGCQRENEFPWSAPKMVAFF